MIRIDHVTFTYGGGNENAGGVQDVNLNIVDYQNKWQKQDTKRESV